MNDLVLAGLTIFSEASQFRARRTSECKEGRSVLVVDGHKEATEGLLKTEIRNLQRHVVVVVVIVVVMVITFSLARLLHHHAVLLSTHFTTSVDLCGRHDKEEVEETLDGHLIAILS